MRLYKWHICITKNEIVYCGLYAQIKEKGRSSLYSLKFYLRFALGLVKNVHQ